MEELALGTTDLQVTRLGLGTVELGMPYGIGLPAPPPDTECIRLLRAAFDAGVRLLDTAAAYGRSEELIGRAFDGCQRPVIATKVSTQPAGQTTPLRGTALRQHLEDSVATSRQRLRLEQLPLLQFHNLEPEQLDDELFGAMAALVARGWVRYWGASTYGSRAPAAVARHPERFATLQVAYNMLDRQLEEEVLPACRRAGIGTLFRSVFLKGVLSDRYQQLPPRLEPLGRAAAAAAQLAAAAGLTLPQLALRFATFSPCAQVVLCGTASLAELQANLQAVAAGPLPVDLVHAIRSLNVSDPTLLNPATWGF